MGGKKSLSLEAGGDKKSLSSEAGGGEKKSSRLVLSADVQIWAGPISKGRVVVAMVNRGTTPRTITTDWKTLRLPGPGMYNARNLWRVSGREACTEIALGCAAQSAYCLCGASGDWKREYVRRGGSVRCL